MKIAVIINAYDNWKRVCSAIDRFYAETDLTDVDFKLFVFYYRYPLPNSAENYDMIFKKCQETNTHLVVAGDNKGQDGNLMTQAKFFLGENFDIFVAYDTDIAPRKPTWLKDARKVFLADEKCGFVTIDCKITDHALQHQTRHDTVSSVPVAHLSWPGGWPLLIFRMSFLQQGYEQWHSFYGGTEGAILKALTERQMTGYMMREHDDARNLEFQDELYAVWKKYAIDKPKALSFEQWLKDNEEYLKQNGH